ncbi:MFS transporter [Delphinella strobiligena]|nr:MFS transporter [Delphinella strobiligena]
MAQTSTPPFFIADEKARFSVSHARGSNASQATIEDIDPEIERRVIRKCDWRVVPPTIIIFALSFVDRVNIGNARIEGLEKDLDMHGTNYNVALLIVFVPFILCETPSNLILKIVSPRTWLSFLLFGCGLMSMCQGLVHSYGALVACRFILGIFEGGLSPGTILLISMYYRREELPWRLSWWYMSGTAAGAFGGLLAYAIANMDGIQGYSGWRWIFIIEGCFTMLIAIVSYFWLVDWPVDSKFLNDEERKVLLTRLSVNNEGEARMDRVNWRRCFGDWKVWLGALMYGGIVNTNYATNYFNPTLLKELGYTSASAQVHSIPLYVVASGFCLATCYASGKTNNRYVFLIFGVILGCIGYIILLVQRSGVSVQVKYMALFFITSSGYIVQPMVVSWVMNCASGHYKRAFTSGTMIGLGNAAGLIASNVFITTEAPYYPTGYGTSLGLLVMSGVVATIYLLLLKRENRKRDLGLRDERMFVADADNLGDDHPSFRFSF